MLQTWWYVLEYTANWLCKMTSMVRGSVKKYLLVQPSFNFIPLIHTTDFSCIETQCGIPLTKAQQTSPPWVPFQDAEVSRSDEPFPNLTDFSPLAIKGAQADHFTHRHLYCKYLKLDRMDQSQND